MATVNLSVEIIIDDRYDVPANILYKNALDNAKKQLYEIKNISFRS